MSRKDSDNEEQEAIEYELVSKSAMKREMHRVQALGERLLSLRKDQLATIPLTERLLASIEESRRITSNEAKRRHMQFIGKLMRDNDIDAIAEALDRLDPSSELFVREQQQAEAWRTRLIREDHAEGEWFDQYPDTDRQPFRAMIRAARKEQSGDTDQPIQSGRQSKKLLQKIRQIMHSNAL